MMLQSLQQFKDMVMTCLRRSLALYSLVGFVSSLMDIHLHKLHGRFMKGFPYFIIHINHRAERLIKRKWTSRKWVEVMMVDWFAMCKSGAQVRNIHKGRGCSS